MSETLHRGAGKSFAAELGGSLARQFPLLNELLTKRLGRVLAFGAAILLAVNAAMFAHAVATSKNLVTIYGPAIGGDFLVFDTAARAAASGDAVEVYNDDAFTARLADAIGSDREILLPWMYPPTLLTLILWLAALPYLAGYAAWAAAGGAVYFLALRPVLRDRLAAFMLLASPAAMQALITGQTGFLTGGLLALAALYAERRPILAGVAASVLTFKPQLGVLVPVAFAAAGAWRAFAVAAFVALALAGLTTAMFGAEVWSAFWSAITEHSGRIQSGVFPFEKLVSVYGGAVMIGTPFPFAMGAQIAAGIALAVFTWICWRRVKAPDLRMAALATSALLAAPNAAYYELTLALPALVVVANRAARTGWLAGERALLGFVWAAPMAVLAFGKAPGPPVGFLIAFAAFSLVARRALRAREEELAG